MPNDVQGAIRNAPKPEALYAKLEDRILARDQQGASEVYYDLVRQRRPMTEIIAEAVRIHAPYTHVPYHERIDDGYVNFVNNDHCLLSARAATQLTRMVPEDCAALPLAQTIWYIPTGLDIWNQKILKAPGHYARAPGWSMPPGPPPMPEVVWPDQEPERLDGPLQERLDHWMTLVHRGNVIEAYRVFLGLMANPAERQAVLAQLCHAGLMDVQDRALYNRSYTTGHKAFRARATVELGNALGWDNAHNVVYAGALDIAVGPRWYSTYEMACNVIKIFLEKAGGVGDPLWRRLEGGAGDPRQQQGAAQPRRSPGPRTRADPRTRAGLSRIAVSLPRRRQEPAPHPRRDADRRRPGDPGDQGGQQFLVAAALLRIPEHDGLVLRQFRAQAAGQAALPRGVVRQPRRLAPEGDRRRRAGNDPRRDRRRQADARRRSWTGSTPRCWRSTGRTAPPGPRPISRAAPTGSPWSSTWHCSPAAWATIRTTRRSARSCSRITAKNQGWDRDRLLLACAHHTAVHRKYGNPLDCATRFGAALGIARLHEGQFPRHPRASGGPGQAACRSPWIPAFAGMTIKSDRIPRQVRYRDGTSGYPPHSRRTGSVPARE